MFDLSTTNLLIWQAMHISCSYDKGTSGMLSASSARSDSTSSIGRGWISGVGPRANADRISIVKLG